MTGSLDSSYLACITKHVLLFSNCINILQSSISLVIISLTLKSPFINKHFWLFFAAMPIRVANITDSVITLKQCYNMESLMLAAGLWRHGYQLSATLSQKVRTFQSRLLKGKQKSSQRTVKRSTSLVTIRHSCSPEIPTLYLRKLLQCYQRGSNSSASVTDELS